MKYKRIKIENFRNIKNSEFNYDSNINIFSSGKENGEGKSSYLDALLLLYFNKTKGKLDDFINWDADYFYLESEAILNNKNIFSSIKYSKKNKTERKLIIENEDEPYINSDAVKKLNELLNANIALNSSVFLQGSNDIIQIKPAERRELLKNIHELKYPEIIKNIELEIKNLKDQSIKEIDNKLLLLENKQYNIKTLFPFDEEIFKNTKIELEKLLLEVEENKLNKIKCDGLREEVYLLRDQSNEDTKIITENEDNKVKLLKQITDIGFLLDDTQGLFKTMNRYKQGLNDLTKNKIEKIQKEIDSIIINRIIKFDEQLLNKKNQELMNLKAKIILENNNISKLQSGVCPVCDKECKSDHLEKKQSLVINLENKKNNLIEEINILNDKKREYDLKIEEKRQLKHKKEILETKLDNEEKNYEIEKKHLEEKILSENKFIEQKITTLKKDKEKYAEEVIKNEITVNNKLCSLNEKTVIIKEKLVKLKQIDKVLDQDILVKIERFESEVKESEQTRILNLEYEKQNKILEKEKKEDIKNIKLFYKDKDIILEKINDNERVKNLYHKEIPNYVLNKLVVKVEENMNKFLEETYEGKYKVAIKEKKESIYIYYGPKNSDIINASGYEQQIISSAYKYALTKLNNINYPFILDEADGFATEKNSVVFYDYICNYYKDKQIIMVTQKEETKNHILNNFNCKLFEISKGQIIHES